MGVLIKRGTYSTTIEKEKAKQLLLSAVARYFHILGTTAETSINMELEGPLDVAIIKEEGSKNLKEAETIDDTLFKNLIQAESFDVKGELSKMAYKCKPKVHFWYDEEKNHGTSINVEFISTYMEGVSLKFFATIGLTNIPKSKRGRAHADSLLRRLKKLWETVLFRYVGDTMSSSIQEHALKKYEPGAMFVNIFGNMVKIRED